ncbi:DUF1643 domain-containing protein [Halobacillus karajensis]|uniref:DUF1643 domain-containing protein n=1 Tax=Halobacillus karajensis TaxID=195088 RepID=UPI0014289E29|nr:DUF1643 domain-containing protein [Halobacillus karajensis]
MKKVRFVERCEISSNALYRYVLQVRIAPEDLPERKLVVIQKNPSIADENETDATARRVENWARLKGFTTVVYLNLFAYRSTDPKKLNAYPYNKIVGERNNETLKNEINREDTVIIGWGNASDINKTMYMKRAREVHQLVLKAHGRVCIVGEMTKEGYPRHGLLWRNQYDVKQVRDNKQFSYL